MNEWLAPALVAVALFLLYLAAALVCRRLDRKDPTTCPPPHR